MEDSPLFTPEDQGDRKKKPTKRDRQDREASPAAENGGEPPKAIPRTETNASSFEMSGSSEKYRKIKKVGAGAYGSVFMSENERTKEVVAIKVTARKEDPVYGGFPLSVLREISIMRRLNHDNIVTLYEIAQTPSGDPLIVMEYCHASLLELLQSRRHNLSFSEVKYVSRQLLDATKHMHQQGILHRDLATKNILFNLSGVIKVCDFGISRIAFGKDEEFGLVSAKELENPNMIVSLPYRAIELLLGDSRYGPALDVWSVGCIVGEVLLCQAGKRQTFFGGDPRHPNRTPLAVVEEIFKIVGKPTEETWPGLNQLPLLQTFVSANIDRAIRLEKSGDESMFVKRFLTKGEGSCVNAKYGLTENCFDLLGGLLTLCPTERLDADQALKHVWFTENPKPHWHKEHWAKQTTEIARGTEKINKSEGPRDANEMLLELDRQDQQKRQDEVNANLSLKAQVKHDLAKRAKAGLIRQQSNSLGGEAKLPQGWTKHWSSSKNKHYYHDSKTGKNAWEAPRS